MSVEFTSLNDLSVQGEFPFGNLDDTLLHSSGSDETEDSNLLLLANSMRSKRSRNEQLSVALLASGLTCLAPADLHEGCNPSRS